MGRRENVVRDSADALNKEFPRSGNGVRAVGVSGDVRKQEDADTVVAAAVKSFGGLDILVNGAAGNFLCIAEDLSLNAFRTVIEIDLIGSFNMCRASFQELKRSRGSVINITANLDGIQAMWQSHPRAAKAGVDSLTLSLAGEWSEFGIRVNSLAPGPIQDTEGFDRLVKGADISDFVPLGRAGTVTEMGQICLFLCSPAAAYITGQKLIAEGGQGQRRTDGLPRSFMEAMKEERASGKAKL